MSEDVPDTLRSFLIFSKVFALGGANTAGKMLQVSCPSDSGTF